MEDCVNAKVNQRELVGEQLLMASIWSWGKSIAHQKETVMGKEILKTPCSSKTNKMGGLSTLLIYKLI